MDAIKAAGDAGTIFICSAGNKATNMEVRCAARMLPFDC